MKLSTSDMLKFYKQYKADRRDGFASNIDLYVKSRLIGLSKKDIEEIIKELKSLIKDDNTDKHT